MRRPVNVADIRLTKDVNKLLFPMTRATGNLENTCVGSHSLHQKIKKTIFLSCICVNQPIRVKKGILQTISIPK